MAACGLTTNQWFIDWMLEGDAETGIGQRANFKLQQACTIWRNSRDRSDPSNVAHNLQNRAEAGGHSQEKVRHSPSSMEVRFTQLPIKEL